VKAVTNALNANVPTRLTLAQFNADSRQAGGTGLGNDPLRLAQRRLDRRTVIGGLYERHIDANTVFLLEADYDVRGTSIRPSRRSTMRSTRTSRGMPTFGTTAVSATCRSKVM
jgi:hypothetical protein